MIVIANEVKLTLVKSTKLMLHNKTINKATKISFIKAKRPVQ